MKTYTTIKTAEAANEKVNRLFAEGADRFTRISYMPDGEEKEQAWSAHWERSARDFGVTAQELAAAAENATDAGDLETARQLLDIADEAVKQAKISAMCVRTNRAASLAYTNAQAAVDAARTTLENVEQFGPREFTTFWCERHGSSADPTFDNWCSDGARRNDYMHCQMVEVKITKTGRTRNQVYAEEVAS